ncbi:MAG: hypothetical protein ABW034_05700 [Steroidobacteraceae bacterium]
MRTAILCCGIVLSLSACGNFERGVAKFKGHSQQCVDGVMYLQFSSGATVKYRPDGSVWTCGGTPNEPVAP